MPDIGSQSFTQNMSTMSNSRQKRLLKARLAEQKSQDHLSAFRVVEKKYLSRLPLPDYSEVIDLSSVTADAWPVGLASHELKHDLYARAGEQADTLIGQWSDGRARKAYTLEEHLGIILIPNAIAPSAQRQLIRNCLEKTAKQPNANNLDTHYVLPSEGLWYHYKAHYQKVHNNLKYDDLMVPTIVESGMAQDTITPSQNSRRLVTDPAITSNTPLEELQGSKQVPPPSTSLKSESAASLMLKMRWTNLGLRYHWTSKSYDFSGILSPIGSASKENAVERPSVIPVPVDLSELSKMILSCIPDHLVPFSESWSNYKPESGIVNFYQLKNTLMGHIDQSELCTDKPLVSFSFGHAAVFLIGGTTREETPTAIYLKSGDALIMSGPSRRVFHGVPRILEGSLPAYLSAPTEESDDWSCFADYLKTSRINVNIRQVFPDDYFTAA